MAGQGGESGGVRASSADVADGDAPGLVSQGEHVVEVAPDVALSPGGVVSGGKVDADDLRQLRGEETGAQGLGKLDEVFPGRPGFVPGAPAFDELADLGAGGG